MCYRYKPVPFFAMAILGTWILEFIAAYFSYQHGMERFLILGLIGLFVPFTAALIMIYGSENQELIRDFWNRVFLCKIKPNSLVVIVLLMPLVLFLATALSLLFGQSTDQFALASEYNVMKGWRIFSLVIPFLLAPLLEELGWRGYGVDSLRAYFNLFTTSILFGLLWGIWHLPLFFINGYYQHSLWNLGIVYVLNFFISILPVAFLTNWIYYTNNRSIPAIILFHAMINIYAVMFKTDQFTKCIVTILLCVVATLVVLRNKSLFFYRDPAF